MRRRVVGFVASTAFGGLVSVMIGCAGEEAQARAAEYPEAVGYTAIGSDSPTSAPTAAPSPPSSPSPQGPTNNAPPPASPPGGGEVAQGAPPPPPPSDGAALSPPRDGAPQDGPPPDGAPPGPPDGTTGGPDDGSGYADADPSALSDFRSALEPYGNWVDDPTYGTVWVPSPGVVGEGFAPYVSAGHWAYDDDYVWVSDYDWGWAPFHYGRWVYAGPMGWEWIPGRTYAGAWVAWRYGVGDWGYVGWAPLGPTWCWRGGRAVGIGFVPRAPYSFVGAHELFASRIGGRLVAGPQVGVIASHTQPFIPAAPRVGSSLGARFAVGGPPLSALNIAPSEAARPGSNRGLAQARAYSRPSTAVALGARGPQPGWTRAEGAVASERFSGSIRGPEGAMYEARVPAYAPAGPSHFGGRLGVGFSGSVASAPVTRSYSPPRAYFESPRRVAGPSYGSPSYASPSYASRSSTTLSGGGYRGYSPSIAAYSGGGFRGAAPAAPAAPSGGFRGGAPSAPSGSGFHGGGGGGGFHGGGGRGGGRR